MMFNPLIRQICALYFVVVMIQDGHLSTVTSQTRRMKKDVTSFDKTFSVNESTGKDGTAWSNEEQKDAVISETLLVSGGPRQQWSPKEIQRNTETSERVQYIYIAGNEKSREKIKEVPPNSDKNVKTKERFARSLHPITSVPIKNQHYYKNLPKFISDFSRAMDMVSLTVFADRAASRKILRAISVMDGVVWNMQPCSNHLNVASAQLPRIRTYSSYAAQVVMQDDGLMISLCDKNATQAILKKMKEHLKSQTWLIFGEDEIWSPDVYISIESMVILVTRPTPDTFLLREVWYPSKILNIKRAYLGTWYENKTAVNDIETEDGSQEESNGDTAVSDIETENNGAEGQTGGSSTDGASAKQTSGSLLNFTERLKYDRRADMTGINFVVTFNSNERAHHKKFDPTINRTILSGFFGDIWDNLRRQLNFTYTLRSPEDGEYGRIVNGSWTGLIADVQNQRADVIVAFLAQTYERAQVVDYSTALLKFSYRIFARPSATNAISWTSYTQPFSFNLWLTLAIALILMMVSFWGLSSVYRKYATRTASAGDGIRIKSTNATRTRKIEKSKLDSGSSQYEHYSPLTVWAAMTQQGWSTSPDNGSLRIVFWTAYALGVMILVSYSAKLVSFLTVIGNDLKFDTLEDLKALKNYRLGIQRGTSLETLFQTPMFHTYWSSLIEPYDDTLASSYKDLRASALADPTFTYIGSLEVQRLNPVGACIFKAAKQTVLFNDGALAWTKGSPYGPLFNHFINKMRESGVLYRTKLAWYPEAYTCPDTPFVPVDFYKVISAFVMLVFGMGLSVVLFIFEIIVGSRKRRHEEKRDDIPEPINLEQDPGDEVIITDD